MYDYVLQFGLDDESTKKVQVIRNHIRLCGFIDKQRGWPPHITIEKYNCNNRNEFVERVEKVVSKLSKFDIDLNSFGKFSNGTLFITPTPADNFVKAKELFDEELGSMKVPSKYDNYNPHVTLCTNDHFEQSKVAAFQKFKPFTATVTKVWIYTENMVLVKEFELLDNTNNH